jgi:outer membrane protein TolC
MNKTRWLVLICALFLLLAGIRPLPAQETENLTLKKAVNLALQNSRELAMAKAQYAVALDTARVNRAEFLPNLYTGSGAAYTNGFPQTPGGAPSVFEMSYTQSILNPPLRGQLRAAEDRAENQRLEMENSRNSIIVRTATSYLELAKVRHSLELLRTERARAQKILEVTRQRTESGVELSLELTRGELNSAKIEQRVIQLEGRDEILSEQLRDLTGLPSDQRVEVSTEELPERAAEPEGQLIDLALAYSLSVKEAENERSARQHILQGEHGGYWPTVDLVGQYSILSRFNNYDLYYNHFQRNNLNVGVQVKIPIFAARTSANVALARSQLATAEINVGTKRRDLRLDVVQKLRSVRELDAAKEVARLDLKLAQETTGLTQSKFDEGRATLRDLEQSRLDENEKWLAFLDAEFAKQKAQLAVMEATGQLAKVFQ